MLIVVGLLAVAAVVLHWPVAAPELQIGPETTVLDGPVNPDGTINYLAALNAEAAQGVTNDNNAAVLLVRAFGPMAIESMEAREVILGLFGLESLPGEGAYFVRLKDWAAAQPAPTQPAAPPGAFGPPGMPPLPPGSWPVPPGGGPAGPDFWSPSPPLVGKLREQLGESVKAPWDPKAQPELAKWLQENDAALDLVAEAGGRSRYYVPRVPRDDMPGLLWTWPGGVGTEMEAARGLEARAMRKLHAGDMPGAWADTRAAWRLGRLEYQRRDVFGCLASTGMEQVACQGTAALTASGQLIAEAARGMLAEIDALPPRGDVVEAVDRGERFAMLDAMMAVMRGVPIDAIRYDSTKPLRRPDLDPNEMLRVGNHWYDQLVGVMRKPAGPERAAADEAYKQDLLNAKRQAQGPAAGARRLLLKAGGWPCRKARSRQEGLRLVAMLMPVLARAATLQEEGAAKADLTLVAVALAGHRAQTGRYPDGLGELSPGWLKEIPPDRFTGKDLVYRRTEAGYVLYSPGPDGVDDQGLQREKYAEKYDVVIRVPPAADEPQVQPDEPPHLPFEE